MDFLAENGCNPGRNTQILAPVNRTDFGRLTLRPLVLIGLGLFIIAGAPLSPTLRAQDALVAAIDPVDPTPLVSDTSPYPEPPLPSSSENSVPSSTDTARGDLGVPRRFHYQLRLNAHAVYDDNINISNGDRISDIYTAIEPSITFGFGDLKSGDANFILVNYMASLFLFADHDENDALQHLFQLQGQYQLSRLTLSLTQSIQILDGTDLRNLDSSTGNFGQQVNLDVAGRTRYNIYDTRVNAAYYLTGKTFLSVGGDYSLSDYDTLISSSTASANIFINYNYSPKLVIGLGGTFGKTMVDDPNPDETFQQGNIRLSYQATGKIDLAASAGVEVRHFDGDLRDEYVTPVFELTLNYLPFDGTRIFLTANRRTNNSAVLLGQDFAVTNFTAGIQQRFLQRFTLAFDAGYENGDYFSTVGAPGADRLDNYFFVEPSITVRVTRFWTLGAYYLHRANDSSFDAFSFHDNQVGVRTSLEF